MLGDLRRWGALLAAYTDADGARVLCGLEPLWGFSCPVLLPEPENQAHPFVDSVRRLRWDRLVITGLTEPSPLFGELARELLRVGDVYRGDGIHRCVADLTGGYDAWVERRTPRFRRQQRRRERAASVAGITIEDVVAAEGLMDRLLAIEADAWKKSDGMASPAMTTMYRTMVDRLSDRGRLRASIAKLDGRDVGFILGGVRSGIYRGLQLSYVEAAAGFEVGHLLQDHQLRRLPGVHTYDLGMDIPYKRRWADRVCPTTVLVARRQ